MSNLPISHPSSKELNGGNIYSEVADLTTKKDTYLKHQKDIAPTTYADDNKPLFIFSLIIKYSFPLCSLGLIGVCAHALVQSPSMNVFITALSLFGILAIFGINEAIKMQSLTKYFKSKANGWDFSKSLLYKMIVTALISIAGSAVGGYLMTYQSYDQSEEININADQEKEKTELRIDTRLAELRSDKLALQKTLQDELSKWKGGKWRTKRGKINDKYLTLIEAKDKAIDKAESKLESKTATIEQTAIQNTDINTKEATKAGLIILVVVIALELGNLFSNSFYWVYKVKSTNEGILFAGLDRTAQKSAMELQFIEVQRRMQELQFLPSGYQLTNQDQDKKEDKQIGFKQGQNTKRKGSDFSYEKLAELVAKKVADNRGDSSPQKTSKNIHTFSKEISIDNQHPSFSKNIQPTKYRGINETKYKAFLKACKRSKNKLDRYDKEYILKASKIGKDSYLKYLKIATEERNDLSK